MKSLLLALLLVLPSAVTTQITISDEVVEQVSHLDTQSTQYERGYAKYYGWQMACEQTLYSCSEHEMPKVVYEYTRRGLYGYYEGGDTVFVSSRLTGMQLKATVIHEMIHYLHVQEDLITVPGFAEPICWSENEAFTKVDNWLEQQGYGWMKRGPNWWEPYTHCWPYYQPNFDVWAWLDAMVEELIDDIIDGEI